jgi:anti-sigma-K factor RskA
MDYSEDHIALAAEYALGTLDADERSQVETMMSVDKEFTTMVHAWEFRLGVLNQMVGSVEPRAEVWDRIRNAAGLSEPQTPIVFPEPLQPPLPPIETSEPVRSSVDHPSNAPSNVIQPNVIRPNVIEPGVSQSNVVRLPDRSGRWRGIASAMTAIAAGLVALLGIQIVQPDWLPQRLRPKPRTQIVEVRAPVAPATPSAQYVALLQGQGGGPAFILTVDGASKNFTLRRVGATAPEPGKSFELWIISDKLPKPRSLGVITPDNFTARPLLAAYDPDVVNNATYAVTVEQAGGSPDGNPHSAPVFSGKLIETVPPPPR